MRHDQILLLRQVGREHWLFAERILRYLKTSDYRIIYVKSDEKLKAFWDSDWAGDIDDRRSCLGNVLTLPSAPISWNFRKQKSVTLSTMEAEYAALSEVSREIVHIKRLLMHIGFEKYTELPIDVFGDNQNAIELSKNSVYHKRSKHIDISFHYTRELVERKEIVITYVRTNFMPADILTKPSTKYKHEKYVEKLNLK